MPYRVLVVANFPVNFTPQAGHEQAPGVYWAKLDAGGRTFTRRIVFLR